MNTTATRVRLHGKLGIEMGRDEWEFVIEQPREVMAAIDANTGGKMRQFLMRERDVEYRVLVDGKAILPVRHPTEAGQGIPPEFYARGPIGTIDIVPVPAGAGLSGLWQTIAGAVLAVVGVALLFTPLAPLASYAILGGLALMAGGVAQMLAPTPRLGLSAATPNTRAPLVTNTRSNGESALVSYLFNGVAAPVGEGGPVPICYGEMVIGAQAISVGLYGAPLGDATIGAPTPPGETSYFYDLPMWAELEAQAKAAQIETALAVKQLTNTQVGTLWLDPFWLPANYPSTWPTVKLAGKPIAVKQKRAWLGVLSALFNQRLSSITLKQAREIYRLLGLSALSQFDFEHAGWNLTVQAIGEYYQTHETQP